MKTIVKTIFKSIFSFITNRLFLLLLIVIGLFYVLIARVFDLTIIQGDELAKEFELSVIRDIEIEGQRGNIYDRNGYPLAENVIAYNVMLNDSVVVDDKNKMVYDLISIIHKNNDEIINEFPLGLNEDGFYYKVSEKQVLNFKKNVFSKNSTSDLSDKQVAMTPYDMYIYMRDELFEIDKTIYSTEEIMDILTLRYALYIRRFYKYDPQLIAENISQKTLALIEENKELFPGVSIEESAFRQYNDAPYFAHIIGYTRQIDAEKLELMKTEGYESDDIVGVIGIEEEMEPYLRGYDGTQRVEVNNVGRTMAVIEQTEPTIGNDVYLTIDRNLQIKTYNILEQQLAEILSDKILMKPPYNSSKSHVLFKEVFDSIFRYEMLDTRNFSVDNEYENRLMTTVNTQKEMLTDKILEEIRENQIPSNYEDEGAIYRHFLEGMQTDGLLKSNYKSSSDYIDFKNGDTSFKEMIVSMAYNDILILTDDLKEEINKELYSNIFLFLSDNGLTFGRTANELAVTKKIFHADILEALDELDLLNASYKENDAYISFESREITFDTMIILLVQQNLLEIKSEDDHSINDLPIEEEAYNNVYNYITEEAVLKYDFTKFYYLYLIDLEKFNYVDLTMAIISQEVVSATDEEIDLLLRGKKQPINFVKEKILSLELTPHELALDPSSGSVVISDPDTGEILAMVSYPTYDNSRLVNNFDSAYYTELLHDPTSPLYPRANYSKSAPGSTFKMVAAMAALEEGVVSPTEKVLTTGYFDKIWPPAKCWIYSQNGGSHGSINVKSAIEQSCNYFFYEMGYRLNQINGGFSDDTGIGIIQEYAGRFGLDSKTGIELGEADSTLASRDSSRSMIGQGTNSYTPLQLSRYMNTLVNDGVVQELNIVDKVMDKEGDIVVDFTPDIVRTNEFDQENLDLVKAGMLAVTEGARGGSRYYFQDLDMSVAGKTGTAQLVSSRPSHAVFTGFGPFEDPEISVVTVIQFGYESKYAALNTKKIFKMYFELEEESDHYSVDSMLE